MPKCKQIDNAILELRAGKTLYMNFHELHWFLMAVERYKIDFDLEFNTKISGDEVILMGIK